MHSMMIIPNTYKRQTICVNALHSAHRSRVGKLNKKNNNSVRIDKKTGFKKNS